MHAPMTCEAVGDELRLAGTITEQASLAPLVSRARSGRLVLDLGGITFINSIGVREWVRMQQTAAAANVRLELRRVAVPIIHQLNIMPAARGVSIVSSFFAPYLCNDCDEEHAILLDLRTHGTDLARKRAPAMTCPDCRRAMDLVDSPELYFMFLGA